MKSVGVFIGGFCCGIGLLSIIFSSLMNRLEADCRAEWQVTECRAAVSVTPVLAAETFRDVVKELKEKEKQ